MPEGLSSCVGASSQADMSAAAGLEGEHQLPKVLAVDHHDRRSSRSKVVEQLCNHTDAASALVPASVGLEGRTVGERAAPTHGAKIVRDEFGVSAICRIAGFRTSQLKMPGLVVRPEHATLGAEGACATRERRRRVALNAKRRLPAVASSRDRHVLPGGVWRPRRLYFASCGTSGRQSVRWRTRRRQRVALTITALQLLGPHRLA
jgi:hypothetical protein